MTGSAGSATVVRDGGRTGRRAFRPFGPRFRWRTWAPLLVLVGLCVALALANPRFAEPRNLVRIAATASVPLMIGIGETLVILMGSVDLSVEGMVAVSAMVVVLLGANDSNGHDLGWLAALAAVVVTTGMGVLNGLLQTMLRIPSFMATLGMWFVGLGIATTLLGGSAVRLTDMGLRGMALGRLLGVPCSVWIATGALLLGVLIQYRTRLGRHIMAVGGGEDLAALSGVNVRRVRIAAFGLAGFFYALAGLVAAAQLGQSNAVISEGRLFTAVTAVVVGGTALTGGEGGVSNTLVGTLIVSVLANGMILLGVSPYLQQTLQGLMIIAAVALTLDRKLLRIVK